MVQLKRISKCTELQLYVNLSINQDAHTAKELNQINSILFKADLELIEISCMSKTPRGLFHFIYSLLHTAHTFIYSIQLQSYIQSRLIFHIYLSFYSTIFSVWDIDIPTVPTTSTVSTIDRWRLTAYFPSSILHSIQPIDISTVPLLPSTSALDSLHLLDRFSTLFLPSDHQH